MASGSAGAHAGLLVGLLCCNARLPLTGINVRQPQAEQEGNAHRLAERTAAFLNLLDRWVGDGYSIPTEERVAAVRLLARLIGLVREGAFEAEGLVVLAPQDALRARFVALLYRIKGGDVPRVGPRRDDAGRRRDPGRRAACVMDRFETAGGQAEP